MLLRPPSPAVLQNSSGSLTSSRQVAAGSGATCWRHSGVLEPHSGSRHKAGRDRSQEEGQRGQDAGSGSKVPSTFLINPQIFCSDLEPKSFFGSESGLRDHSTSIKLINPAPTAPPICPPTLRPRAATAPSII